jgi:hypothetical protein
MYPFPYIGVQFGRDAIPDGYYRITDEAGNFITDEENNVIIAEYV